jgi:GxxExxY protein
MYGYLNKNKKMTSKKEMLIYENLSYKINGILFDVFNELGAGLQEKYYQRALFEAFKQNGLKVEQQVHVPLNYKDKKIGNYYLDFLIEDKIIVEIKKGDYFKKTNINQIYQYLVATELALGILANFTTSGVKIKRIVNIY